MLTNSVVKWTVALALIILAVAGRGVALARDSTGFHLQPGRQFQECPHCPKMVVVPSGHFIMGAKETTDGQEDSPRPSGKAAAQEVTIPSDFAAGTYDVTRDEYAVFIRDTGRQSREGCYVWDGEYWIEDRTRSWLNPGFAQTGRDPAVCVSWEDAQAYVRWLNAKLFNPGSSGEDGPYRLPTWEEAEYVAGAGSATAYSWGDEFDRSKANLGTDICRPCKPLAKGRDHWLYTSPGGSFPPNAFGLFDTTGNVWQWTSTCWPDFPDADVYCRFGAVRGGSWLTNPSYGRTSEYWINDRLNHNSTFGFRVARSLDAPVVTAAAPTGEQQWRGGSFRDCRNCPLMRVVPPGSFVLTVPTPEFPGAEETKASDHPARVEIKTAFAVGVYDVSRDEYAAFVGATHRPKGEGCQMLDGYRWVLDDNTTWASPRFKQTRRDPVVCVSWDDANAYVAWLNARVGPTKQHPNGPYRLLTGEEWEYSARAGHRTLVPYYSGSQLGHDNANYGLDQCFPCGIKKEGSDRWYYTSPVGSFSPNAFGLYDMEGNVWQWTEDCDSSSLATAPTDGSAWTTGDCHFRILRGGSYNDQQLFLQLAPRNPFPTHTRNNANGFRVARDLG